MTFIPEIIFFLRSGIPNLLIIFEVHDWRNSTNTWRETQVISCAYFLPLFRTYDCSCCCFSSSWLRWTLSLLKTMSRLTVRLISLSWASLGLAVVSRINAGCKRWRKRNYVSETVKLTKYMFCILSTSPNDARNLLKCPHDAHSCLRVTHGYCTFITMKNATQIYNLLKKY